MDPPSPAWLGHHAKRPAIRSTGLWNVNHVLDAWDLQFIDLLGQFVQAAEGGLALGIESIAPLNWWANTRQGRNQLRLDV